MKRIHSQFRLTRSDELLWDEQGAINIILGSTFVTHQNQFVPLVQNECVVRRNTSEKKHQDG
jgi:hypothetical protein